MTKRAIIIIATVLLATYVYHPGRHAKHYAYVDDSDILHELVTSSAEQKETNLKDCNYADILLNNLEIYDVDINKVHLLDRVDKGGEYKPKHCNPKYKTAIIIPFRDRWKQLNTFLNYIHYFLQKQLIHYKIYVAEQNNTRPFNRAKMLNYGAFEAMKQQFDCLILHDVDLLPLTTGNIYACSKFPRHMSSCVDTFRFNLPYLSLSGGVFSIQSAQFRTINGMSNSYDGWGGEDDDFYMRLQDSYILPYRFSPAVSKYMMLHHNKEKPSGDRHKKLKSALERQKTDGMNTLNDNYSVKLERLHTHLFIP